MAAEQNASIGRRLSERILGRISRRHARLVRRIIALLRMPPPDAPQMIRRATLMERDIVLPIKAAAITMLVISFFFTTWIGMVLGALDIAVESTRSFLLIYILVNIVAACVLLAIRSLPAAVVEWSVMITILVDGVLLATLTLVTGGYSSVVYWIFFGLIIRTAVSVPRGTWQLTLNLTLSACYLVAGYIDVRLAETLPAENPYA